MAKYVLAIDEFGKFEIGTKNSFACGVVVEANELTLKQAYQKVYKEFGFPEPIPNSTNELLQTKEDINDKARFHFNKLTDSQLEICKNNLLGFAKKVYVSKDKPTMFANNQSWWLIAVVVVIERFLNDYPFEEGSEVEVWLDCRSDKVWGVLQEDVEELDFASYHNTLKQQIERRVQNYAANKGVTLKIYFKSDTSSFYINLADLVCGFVRKDRAAIGAEIVETSCRMFTEKVDVVKMANQYPLSALNCIFQEVLNEIYLNIPQANNIIRHLRQDRDEYVMAWDSFNEFVKLKIESRSTASSLVKAKQLIDCFLEEFSNTKGQCLKGEQRLEMVTRFVEYYSHIGEVNVPIDDAMFDDLLKSVDSNSETRALRRWEKKVSFVLRQSQIYFNGYNFEGFRQTIEQCYSQHERIINSIEVLKDEQGKVKDEPTVALLGTLAQTYAYIGDIDQAEEYFILSKEYAIKSNAITDSYLFCLHHCKGDIEACRTDFEAVSKKTPERYAEDKKFEDLWTLLLYCKLRALELHTNGKTALPCIDLKSLSSYNSEYPFPLIMKWEAIALWIENATANKPIVEKYFSDAINNLLSEDNGFAIKTLALPIVQCYGLVNNRNEYHARYNQIVEQLQKQSQSFASYVKSSDVLQSITNKEDLWQRALSLPFIYS
ncbi:MAG: hypothetical protein MSS87_01305 [Bacteroidales bacterium]|nr:hypothetical protein [Bacteroidales bacterium]MDY5737004.1 hypothetical protein [Candidatus Onthomorpha sp.]